MGKRKEGVGINVYILGVVSFFTDVSSEMIFPLIPIFVTTILGAGYRHRDNLCGCPQRLLQIGTQARAEQATTRKG